MRVAFGLKAHSGWAALVVVGKNDGNFVVIDRRRIELVDDNWAKQPYHAAEGLRPEAARELVDRGIKEAHRVAAREMRAAVAREQERKNKVTACAVLVADPMPSWSTEEILAVHFRMHKAEGVLFPDALVSATAECAVRPVAIPKNLLMEHGQRVFRTSLSSLEKKIATMGKSLGPPWGKDQKEAALAAMIALEGRSK